MLFKIQKTSYIIFFLLAWLPLETFVLLHTPIDYYAYVKYIPEVLLYGFVIGSWITYIRRHGRLFSRDPLFGWFFFYMVIAVLSLLVNWYNPLVWVFGLRQLLRFALIAFAILFMQYHKKQVRSFVLFGFGMIVLEAVFGFIQYLAQGQLDPYLFSSQVISIGNTALLGGLEQFWAPGSRIFATLGRYDRLGSLLMIGVVMLFPFLYMFKKQERKWGYGAIFMFLLVVLILTLSRASWLAAFFGIATIGILLHKDRRIVTVFIAFMLFLGVYLTGYALVHDNVLSITETRSQTLAERMFEAVSFDAWRGSYEGFGRIFFIIETPHVVIPAAPLFGHGPGRYGSGVAGSLVLTDVYDELHLPFGIQNKFGQIDNNWMAIWGEVGTLGLISWMGVFIAIIGMANVVRRRTKDPYVQAYAEGCIGMTVGMITLGFFGPYFEFRASMFYFWLLVGILVLYWREEKQRGSFLTW